MNTTPRIPDPTRSIATLARRVTAAEVERIAWMVKSRPGASGFTTVSETSGKERWISRTEAEWLLSVTGHAMLA